MEGNTAKGTQFTLEESDSGWAGHYSLTINALGVHGADATEATVQGMQVLRTVSGYKVAAAGPKPVRPSILITPEIREWMGQAEGHYEALRAAKKAAAAQAEEDVRSGRVPITVSYHDGEYLSGYSCHGIEGDLLISLGLAREVEGWGVHVGSPLVDALGETFTYPQAAKFAAPAIAAKQAATEARDAKRAAVFAELSRTHTL